MWNEPPSTDVDEKFKGQSSERKIMEGSLGSLDIISNIHTTPNLFETIIRERYFIIKGRRFSLWKVLLKNENTLVCKCVEEKKGQVKRHVAKIIKLIETKELNKSTISTSTAGYHQVGDWLFSDQVYSSFSRFLVLYEIAEQINDEIVILSDDRGMDLKTYCKKKKTEQLFIYEVFQILVAVLNGLMLLHRENIIHRDLKPSNIFISKKDTQISGLILDVALGDFGIATKSNYSHSSTSIEPNEKTSHMGTKGYWAPETEKGIYQCKSDIFSLGRTLIWLLFCRDCDNLKVVESLDRFDKLIQQSDLNSNNVEKFIKMGNLERDIAGWTKMLEIIKRMTKLNLNERYSSMQLLCSIFQIEKIDRPIILSVPNIERSFFLSNNNVKNLADFYLNNAINELEYKGQYQKDREIVLEAVKRNGDALLYADESLRKDREIVLEAVKQKVSALSYADESLKKDREIVLQAVKQNGFALLYANESLKKDREFVLQVVKQDGYALKYANESLKKDREIVLQAVKQNGFALSYADESLRKDREFILEAVKQKVSALSYADESLRKDREIVLEAVKQNGYALKYADESLRKDREFILEAVKRNSCALSFADESFKKDRELILEAVMHFHMQLN